MAFSPKSSFSPEYRKAVGVLIEARKGASFTQSELARTLRKPQSFVSKYERFERRLDIAEFVLIARALGYKPADLFAEVEASLVEKEGPR